ncbi:hypothetical protein EDD76_102276 [Kineothrix alysoides]|uniref:Uncharacterized protein n=1 Tax=Kineothrix alysoides TaxID=1469948 RepID=A0A4R1R550_9FIRM|nr:hypothetical protein [Kineothrix alysoides]TCL60578.1 hypothetical protein EDD76_102276 [Kineothrix alysoides]
MEIEIIEGHDGSSYFWIKPVRIETTESIKWEDVREYDEEISIEEGDVECFLAYFFLKYYDSKLTYNYRRNLEYGDEAENNQFEWYLEHNFYTYETMNKMLDDMKKTAILLRDHYDDTYLNEIKSKFSIFYMVDVDSDEYVEGKNTSKTIEMHRDVVIDFYNRFIARIKKMMENNPDCDLLSIMGP